MHHLLTPTHIISVRRCVQPAQTAEAEEGFPGTPCPWPSHAPPHKSVEALAELPKLANTVLFSSHGAWANKQRLYSSGDDADIGVLQSQKFHGVCRVYEPLIRTLLDFTSQLGVHTSLFFIHVIQVLSMMEIFQHSRYPVKIPLLPVLLETVPKPVPKHGLTSSGRLLHCVCQVRCISAAQSFTVSTRGPHSEQVQFIIKTSDLHFLWHVKAVFTKMYHLTY